MVQLWQCGPTPAFVGGVDRTSATFEEVAGQTGATGRQPDIPPKRFFIASV